VAKKEKIRYAMSRRTRAVLFALCILTVVVFACLDHSVVSRCRQTQAQTRDYVKAGDLEKYTGKTFTVINVVDGDTIDIDIADGQYEHTRIRLWGIDTPETKRAKTGVMYFGPQAAEFTKKLTLGKPVTVYLDEGSRTRGKYGRLLAYVKLTDGSFLNEVLLTGGFAYADTRFMHNFYHRYSRLEAVARSQKKGLWLKVTPEQLPKWLQKQNRHRETQ
jgi:micrococcal nuclease